MLYGDDETIQIKIVTKETENMLNESLIWPLFLREIQTWVRTESNISRTGIFE